MSGTVRLRYTGKHATVFMEPGVGAVEPDGEFDVLEAEAERYLRRADVALASEDSSASQDADTSGAGRSGKRGRSGSPTGKNGTGEQ